MTGTGLPDYPPFVLNRETAPAFWLVGTLWLVLASGRQTANRLTVIEQVMATGLGPPTHRHPTASEGFYILEGSCSFNAQGETRHAGPGTFVYLPRLLPHSFSVDTSEVRALNFYLPASFELVVMSLAHPASARRRPSLAESAPPDSQEQIRILSALYGQEAVMALPFAVPPAPELMLTKPNDKGIGVPHFATAEQVPAVRLFGLDWRLLAAADDTEGAYDLFEVVVPAGAGMPLRTAHQDEALYVLAGKLTLAYDDQPQPAGVGTFAYFPAGGAFQWHAEGGDARVLVFHLPGGFDRVVAEAAADDDRAIAKLTELGTRFL